MKKKSVLIIGATGMLGHVVHHYLEGLDRYKLANSVYRTKLNEQSIICDVTSQGALDHLFELVKPEAVINCVGALVQQSKNDPAYAIYLNALLPHHLRDLCNKYQAKLIHVSTDCVFSGRDGNYSEDAFRDADDVYGRSKALGEIYQVPHCTLRTSIIGPELKKDGTGLFHWFMNQEGEVYGYKNALWGGVTTLELAKAIDKVLQNNLTGLLHVTNGLSISKFNLLNLFNEHKKRKSKVIADGKNCADKSLQVSKRFAFDIPSYPQMINEMMAFYKEELH